MNGRSTEWFSVLLPHSSIPGPWLWHHRGPPGEVQAGGGYFPDTPPRVFGVIGQGMGRGSVVIFADDPCFRLFWRSSQRCC